ncbi:Galactokinase [Gracilaria domingensis]|nr:Galactokinase [Gracilaria domingensis]
MAPSQRPSADVAAVERATKLYESAFNETPTIAVAAPGRVNLIGEHVDYNDGFVFPLALEKNTYLVGKALPVGQPCEVAAEAFPGVVAKFTAEDSAPADSVPKWARYLKGMTAIYARKGYQVVPFRAAVVSDVPLGSGLSSSAALEMATGVMIEVVSGLQVDATERALMGQSCEHEFAGVPCGIMDQLISSRGESGKALLIDCRSLEAKAVPLNDPNVVIVVANSCVEHQLSGSEYPTRRRQCADAAKAMKEMFSDKTITHLRDCTLDMLEAVKSKLDEDTMKRATHAISEDIRTLKAKTCLEEGDLETAGKLMIESHESLRDLFEVSTKEIDALVEIALGVDGVYGSRITGGGFGGCTVTLVKKTAVEELMKAIDEKYPAASGGLKAVTFATNAGSGARVITGAL